MKLREGRTQQIRKMFQAVGHPVSKLRRVAIGPISDPKLTPGVWRELTKQEVKMLATMKEPKAPPEPRASPRPRAGRASERPGRSKAGGDDASKRRTPAGKPQRRDRHAAARKPRPAALPPRARR